MSRRAGVAFSYLLLGVQILSSLLFTPYLIRSLGQAEYGLYSLVAAITAYFMLLDAGVGNALVRYVAKFRVQDDLPQQRRFLGLSLIFYVCVGAVVIALGTALRGQLPAIFGHGLTPSEIFRAGVMLRITLFNVVATLVFSVFDRTIVAYERFVFSRLLAIAQVVSRVSVLSLVLHLGYRAVAVVTVNLVLTMLFGIVSATFVMFGLRLRPAVGGVERAFVGEIFGYSGFIFLQMVATQVNAMTDQVLLGIMTTSATVAVYSVGAQVSTYFQSIANSINGVLMPGVVRLVETAGTPRDLQAEMVKVGRLVFIVLGVILVGFAVSGRAFVRLWAGTANAHAYEVALILMCASILSLTQAIGSQILWALGRHKVQALVNVAVAAVNVCLTIVLVRWNPLVGASLATLIAVVSGNVVVMAFVFERSIGVSMKEYYKDLFRGVLPSLLLAGIAGSAVVRVGLRGWIGLMAEVAAVLLAYVVCMQWFGMNPYERRLATSVLGRRGKAS